MIQEHLACVSLDHLNIRRDIPFGRAAIGADLFGLGHHLLDVLLAQPVDLDLHVNTDAEIQIFQTPDQMHGGLDDRVLLLLGHLDPQRHGRRVHGGLEASAVAGGEELLRVRLACIAGPAQRLGHCQVRDQLVTLDMTGSRAHDPSMRGVQDRGGIGVEESSRDPGRGGPRGSWEYCSWSLSGEGAEDAEGRHCVRGFSLSNAALLLSEWGFVKRSGMAVGTFLRC